MSRLLLLDAIRRNWKFLLVTVPLGMMVWLAAGAFAEAQILAASMAIAEFAGPLMAAQFVAPREVRHLPLSRHEIWRTKYCYGNVVVVFAITCGKAAAMGLAPTPGFEALTLSFVFDVLFAAVGSLLFLAMPVVMTPVPTVLVGLAFLATPFLPFALVNELPTRWSEIGVTEAMVMVAALGLAVAGYLRTPRTSVPPSAAATRAAFRARRRLSPSILDRVTGPRRLALKVWLSALGTQAGIIVLIPFLFWMFAILVGDGSELRAELWDIGFLPFDTSMAGRPSKFNMMIVWVFGTGPTLLVGELLRQLRTLPMSTTTLLRVLLGISVLTWINGWLVLVLFHLVATGGPPSTLQLPLLLTMIGGDALLRSLQLRWRNPPWFFFGVIVVGTPIVYILRAVPISATVLFLGLGVVFTLASVAINKETLTKHNKVYARMPRRSPFGTEVPGQS